MLGEAPRFRGRLHLDDADARPQQIEEAASLTGLELCTDLPPVDAVAVEQLG